MTDNWAAEIVQALQSGPCVRVMVVGVRGSAPREIGAQMLVTAEETLGTIGGGQLEFLATQHAVRNLAQIDAKGHQTYIEQIPLGVARGQCCGGVVRLLFQTLSQSNAGFFRDVANKHSPTSLLLTSLNPQLPFMGWLIEDEVAFSTLDGAAPVPDVATLADLRNQSLAAGAIIRPVVLTDGRQTDVLVQSLASCGPPVVIFGAGHVGRACATALAQLNCVVTLIDSRATMLEPSLPAAIDKQHVGDPTCAVADIPAHSFVLIMTHDHALDLALCEQVLQRHDLSHVGLIGSTTKRRRFHKKLRAAGFGEHEIERLNCPIGIETIRSKAPTAIAISVAAEYLQFREARVGTDASWQPVALAGGDRN